MKRISKTVNDDKWLKDFGENLQKIMKARGFNSPYDFWVQEVGEYISRSSLHYILIGKSDPKITTLKLLAKHLRIPITKMFDF